MPNSLVKFVNQQSDGKGQLLHWNRADIDGAPFRGAPPIASEEELETRLVRVCDPQTRQFDLSRPEDNKAYLDVLDRIYNKWSQLIYIKRVPFRSQKKGRLRIVVYMEWVDFYMQDGQPSMASAAMG